ncbi:MAG: GNAT family N-acetyltransferase [Vicinamibacterales bacterium]
MEAETVIRPASVSDAGRLAEFAERVFDDVFGPLNDEGDMASYLNEAFSPEIQRAEIAGDGSIVLLAERGGTLAGYLHIAPAPSPDCVTDASALELKRLYVEPSLHGRGIGKTLLDAGLERARANGARSIWLGVWENNVKAQAFYTREGFTRVGEHPFALGSGTQTDWIMQRSLTHPHDARRR